MRSPPIDELSAMDDHEVKTFAAEPHLDITTVYIDGCGTHRVLFDLTRRCLRLDIPNGWCRDASSSYHFVRVYRFSMTASGSILEHIAVRHFLRLDGNLTA